MVEEEFCAFSQEKNSYHSIKTLLYYKYKSCI